MPIRSLGDLNRAFDDGRWHLQRFQKNAGTAHSVQWADPSFASGQPPYDAHVGAACAFAPCVAQKNDAIYFPPVGLGQHRHLASATFWSWQATFNGPASIVIFDLLGYYPLIDGDSTEVQAMDNTLTLPRYANGEGVGLVLINHIAPAVQGGVAVIDYTDSDGNDRTHTVGVPNNGQNLVCSGVRNSTGTDTGPVTVALANGTRGIRRVNSLQYTTAPGGLHCAYLVKVLATVVAGDNALAVEKEFFSKNGLHCPRIHDGAWLGWFDRIGAGTARSVSWFGNFTFVWG